MNGIQTKRYNHSLPKSLAPAYSVIKQILYTEMPDPYTSRPDRHPDERFSARKDLGRLLVIPTHQTLSRSASLREKVSNTYPPIILNSSFIVQYSIFNNSGTFLTHLMSAFT